MEAEKADFHRLLRVLVAFSVIAATAWVGWSLGHSAIKTSPKSGNPGEAMRAFRVAGSSMVPTAYGASLRTGCLGCGRRILFDPQSLSRPDESLVCTLCGESHPISGLQALAELTSYPGDIAKVSKPSDNPCSLGDLVAIQWKGTVRVKRVAAVPGDVVDIAGQRLLVNGQRVEDRLAQQASEKRPPDLLVDDDSLRTESRWSQSGDRVWQRTSHRRWSCQPRKATPWLCYHHRSVHDHNRPSGVLDDYQYNAAVARRLHEVDRLSLQGTLETNRSVTISVAFWSHDGPALASKRMQASGRFKLGYYDAVAEQGLPVTQQSPVAIRVEGEQVSLASLQVRREIEYRIAPGQERHHYPLRLSADEYFVVGDNVPFSVDSRSWGAIKRQDIVGQVQIVTATSNRH